MRPASHRRFLAAGYARGTVADAVKFVEELSSVFSDEEQRGTASHTVPSEDASLQEEAVAEETVADEQTEEWSVRLLRQSASRWAARRRGVALEIALNVGQCLALNLLFFKVMNVFAETFAELVVICALDRAVRASLILCAALRSWAVHGHAWLPTSNDRPRFAILVGVLRLVETVTGVGRSKVFWKATGHV